MQLFKRIFIGKLISDSANVMNDDKENGRSGDVSSSTKKTTLPGNVQYK